MFVLEIEAEGLPRYVGPFWNRRRAEKWAGANVANGSWSVIPLTAPDEAVEGSRP